MASRHEPLTFKQLVELYGPDMATDLLVIIEKMAHIKPGSTPGGEEARLRRALAIIAAEDALTDAASTTAGHA